MKQKYIIDDIVMYDNKIMVIKEPRDGNHFDLYCPEERLMHCYVDVKSIKPVNLTVAILEKNGWDKDEVLDSIFYLEDVFMGGDENDEGNYTCFQLYYQNKKEGWVIDMCGMPLKFDIHYVHELQHLFFGLGLDSNMEIQV